MDKVGREGFQNIHKNQAAILDEIWSLIVPNYTQYWENNADSRSN
jgi:hypothetical protein